MNKAIPKEVRRMSRLELMEILVEQAREIERLKDELQKARSQVRSVGTVDEAVDRLYEVITGTPAQPDARPKPVRPAEPQYYAAEDGTGRPYDDGYRDTYDDAYDNNYENSYENSYEGDGYTDDAYSGSGDVNRDDGWSEDGEYVELF